MFFHHLNNQCCCVSTLIQVIFISKYQQDVGHPRISARSCIAMVNVHVSHHIHSDLLVCVFFYIKFNKNSIFLIFFGFQAHILFIKSRQVVEKSVNCESPNLITINPEKIMIMACILQSSSVVITYSDCLENIKEQISYKSNS